MGQPAAKANDQVVGTDIHLVMVPAGPSLIPTPLPHPFTGVLDGGLSATVTIGGQAAARAGDIATTCNDPVDAPVGTVVAAGTVMVGG